MSYIRIQSIAVENYRSFGTQQKFTFPDERCKKPISILGYNNSGKTNLMNCILQGVGYKFLQSDTFQKNDLHNLDYANQINIEIRLNGSDYPCPRYWHKDSQSYRVTNTISGTYEIRTRMEENELKSEVSPSMFGKHKFYNIYYINFHKIKEELSTKKGSYGNLTSFLAKHIKKIVDTDQVMAGKKKGFEDAVLASTKKVLEDSDLSQFIERIKVNYTNNLRNNSLDVRFGLPDYEDIFLQMTFKVGLNGERKKLIPIDHFGDGYIAMFVMAVLQAIAESNEDDKCLFLFEEPESFLHENHQEYFYKNVLCSLSEKGHQVIYTTHSDRMVDIFDTKSIIRIEFDEKNKQTEKKYNKVTDFSPKMPVNDNGEEVISYANFNSYIKSVEPNLNKILFSRKVVLVEGANDILAYKIAIEKEVEKTNGIKYAQTYLSFLNIAFIVHHGKGTAYLLIDLCKHFGLDYYVITDWDFPTDFVAELDSFPDELTLKGSELYLRNGREERTSNQKGMITTNWKLLKTAGEDKIHFNIPKLEGVIKYPYDDKDSIGILNRVQSFADYPECFFPQKLRTYLELDKLTNLTGNVVEDTNSEVR